MGQLICLLRIIKNLCWSLWWLKFLICLLRIIKNLCWSLWWLKFMMELCLFWMGNTLLEFCYFTHSMVGNSAVLLLRFLKIRSVRILDTIVCSGTLLWLFSPAWDTLKLTLQVGFICPFEVIDPTNLDMTIGAAQALCLTLPSSTYPQRRKPAFFTNGNKASVWISSHHGNTTQLSWSSAIETALCCYLCTDGTTFLVSPQGLACSWQVRQARAGLIFCLLRNVLGDWGSQHWPSFSYIRRRRTQIWICTGTNLCLPVCMTCHLLSPVTADLSAEATENC